MAHRDEDNKHSAPEQPAPVGGSEGGSDPAAAVGSAAKDVVFVHSETPAGDGYRVIRSREDRLELAEIRELRHGQAIQGEIVRLHPRTQQERIYDVEVLLEAPKPKLGRPAQVATDTYREHYDATFGRRAQWNRRNSSELN